MKNPWGFRARRRHPGQMMVLLTVAVFMLILAVGSGIDYGSILVEEQSIQNAIDTAALAGARGMLYAPTPGAISGEATATAFLNNQGYSTAKGDVIHYAETTDPNTGQLDTMKVEVTRNKPTLFWRIVGINNIPLKRSAVGAPGRGDNDIAIVVDLTQSMQTEDPGTLPELRAAVAAFVDALNLNVSNPITNKIALAAFQGEDCATSSGVVAFGYNASGQIGDSSTTDRWVPVTSDPANSVKVSAGGNHSLSAVASGTPKLRAWGLNDHHQVNGSATAFFNNQQTISPSTTVSQIAAGGDHNLARFGTGTGNLKTWGRNDRGQLGRNGTSDDGTPTTPGAPLSSVSVTGIAAGRAHSLASTGAGATRVYAWGDNTHGQLGLGTTDGSAHTTPAAVTGLPGSTNPQPGADGLPLLAAGGDHSMVVMSNNLSRIWSWGDNTFGQVGNGTDNNDVPTPAAIDFPANVIHIAAGANHSLAVLSDGTVWAWGSNANGQLGTNDVVDATPCTVGATPCSRSPRQVSFVIPAGDAIVRVYAGYSHSVAVDNFKQLWVWGSNAHGELGTGDVPTEHHVPVTNYDVVNVTWASAGGTAAGGHTLAVACTGLALDSHVLIPLTADRNQLVMAAATPAPVPPCPTLPPQPSFTMPAQPPGTYMCYLDAVGGSGTYHRAAVDIVFKEGTPDWNIFANGGRPEAKKFFILMTDGQNNLTYPGAPPNTQTCDALITHCGPADFNSIQDAIRLKKGANGVQESPCLQTTNPPCDDVEIFTVGIFKAGASGLTGTPHHCANRTSAEGLETTVPASAMSVDWELIHISSSKIGCDHYYPLLKGDTSINLSDAFRSIAGQIRGELRQ